MIYVVCLAPCLAWADRCSIYGSYCYIFIPKAKDHEADAPMTTKWINKEYFSRYKTSIMKSIQ